MKGKLTEEQKAEIIRRYQAGESGAQLATCFPVSGRWICQIVREAGCVRASGEAKRLGAGWEPDLLDMTPGRWRELYCYPGSGYPSVVELARHFGVSNGSIRRRLFAAGIQPRTQSEQQRIEFRLGRKKAPAGNSGNFGGKHGCTFRDLPRRELLKIVRMSAQRRAALYAEARIRRPCAWCGAEVIRKPSRAARWDHQFCSQSHRGSYGSHLRLRGPDAPRPLIVEKLIELNRGWPNTYERLAKVGEKIGAKEPEILEVLARDVA